MDSLLQETGRTDIFSFHAGSVAGVVGQIRSDQKYISGGGNLRADDAYLPLDGKQPTPPAK